jgi:hypothetical protein
MVRGKKPGIVRGKDVQINNPWPLQNGTEFQAEMLQVRTFCTKMGF